jgi:hypothetical protein
MVYVLLPPDAQRHAVRDATDILGITTGRCEAAYLAVRCPPTHSGMPHEMPPICRVSLVVPQGRVRAPQGVCVPPYVASWAGCQGCRLAPLFPAPYPWDPAPGPLPDRRATGHQGREDAA